MYHVTEKYQSKLKTEYKRLYYPLSCVFPSTCIIMTFPALSTAMADRADGVLVKLCMVPNR